MILSKSRRYTINMGDYNSFAFEATITLDSETDMGVKGNPTDAEIVDLLDFADKLLVESLREEVNQAKLAPNQKSAIHTLLAKRKEA